MNIIVIGGGISGLTCAWQLKQRGLPVILVEQSHRFGGVIDTIEKDGFRFDVGPQSFIVTEHLSPLFDETGLTPQLVKANPRAPRYLLFRGRLIRAPSRPLELWRTPLVGLRTKFRLFGEAFGRTRPPTREESVADFVRRKFGEDLLNNIISPFVSGVYAGDPEKLSLASAFPALWSLEARYGSIIRGAIQSRRRSGGTGSSLCNFKSGMTALTSALANRLGEAAICDAQIIEIRHHIREAPERAGASLEITFMQAGSTRSLPVSAIVVATPTSEAARLLGAVQPSFAQPLSHIEYADLAQVSAGYHLNQISWRENKQIHPARLSHDAGDQLDRHPPDADPLTGFGFLVPRSEGLRLLGTVWNSSLFPCRAPEKMVSFTSFIGGVTDPQICRLSEHEIARIVHAELASVLDIAGSPVVEHVIKWSRALPQYNIGHAQIASELSELCARTPGIFLAGNYLAGPSLGSCVAHSSKLANDVAAFVNSTNVNSQD